MEVSLVAVLADLEAIIGPPAAVPPAIDWLELERLSGLRFPADYKQLANRYAMLEIDAFLDVHHLGMAPDIPTMLSQCRQVLDPLRQLNEKYGFIYLADGSGSEVRAEPYPVYPEPNGLFPWGATDNGDTLLWLTDADPDRWTIVVTDNGTWWHFDCGLIDYLAGVLGRTLPYTGLTDSFPEPEFKVFQYSSLDQLPSQ
jgi:hypothetical protein